MKQIKKFEVLVRKDSDSNDIIDNSHDLECASLHYNQYLRRPYYHENGIFSAYPRKGFWKYSPTIKIVRSLNVLVHLTYYLATDKPFSRACENLDDHPAYPEALESTKSHIKHALTDRDRTSFIFFAVDDTPWIGEVMADCTQRNNVSFISDVRQSLDQAEKDGLDIQGPALEGHWNPRGHQLVGETIYDFAIAEGILPPQ